MSGIFKGDSIYKIGGGGGGYKDGGQLVDGDFIEVKNNTVSSYENVSRDPVNFYFDIKDGEILNSSIEFTTQVNATVNVYYIGNGGILIPLGYISSNTVTAGESYNLIVMGKSFVLENVTEVIPDPDNINVFNDMDGVIYNCVKLDGIYWATSNYKDYCQWSETETIQRPWRVPTRSEFTTLKNNHAVETVTKPGTWNSHVSPAPTNTTGLSLKGIGYKETKNGPVQMNEMGAFFWQDKNIGGVNCFGIRVFQSMYNPNDCYWDLYSDSANIPSQYYSQLRLVFDP